MTKFTERFTQIIFGIAASVSILAVVLICFFLFANGVPAMLEIGIPEFLGGSKWRPTADQFVILAFIVSSLYVTAGALIIGVPIGLLCAIYMARFAPKKFLKVMLPGIELLAGIPSVVYGFFGLVLLVPLIRVVFNVQGMSILAASIILGIMILPTIVTVSYAAMKAVPQSYYEGGLALGASHEFCVMRLIVPAAASGIMAGVILGMGRAVGETMAVIMIVGNKTGFPDSIFDGARTLTSNIVLEMSYAADLHYEALIATGVVLFVFILIINMAFAFLNRTRKA
jgi:phosphate transport system permease protein